METSKKKSKGTCRCCLDEGTFDKNHNLLNNVAANMNNINYLEMLSSCFSINVVILQDNSQDDKYICDLCIIRLKDSFLFKTQVVEAQKALQEILQLKQEFQIVAIKNDDDDMVTDGAFDDGVYDNISLNDLKTELKPPSKKQTKKRSKLPRKKPPEIKKPTDEFKLPISRKKVYFYETDWEVMKKECGGLYVTDEEWKQVIDAKICLERKQCLICNRTFDNVLNLRSHQNEHFPMFSCKDCDKSFALKNRIIRHIPLHEKGHFACEKCHKTFKNKANWTYHSFRHGYKDRKCHVCLEIFEDYWQKKNHMFIVHGNKTKYNKKKKKTCEQPTGRGVQMSELSAQTNKKSVRKPKAKEIQCSDCSFICAYASSLDRHMRQVHLKERSFVCEECGKGFFLQDLLDRHKVVHTGDRPYMCELCPKVYKHAPGLWLHMKVHYVDRRYMCNECKRTFLHKRSLKMHIKTHEKETFTF